MLTPFNEFQQIPWLLSMQTREQGIYRDGATSTQAICSEAIVIHDLGTFDTRTAAFVAPSGTHGMQSWRCEGYLVFSIESKSSIIVEEGIDLGSHGVVLHSKLI